MPREGFLRVSVIIPVYNEWQTVAEIIRQVKRVPVEKEIFVVDDGSTDGTRDILASLQGDPEVHIFYHSENRGKGAAIRTALKHVTGEVVIIQDADLEYDPRDYTALLRPIEEGRADVVYGSRFRGGTNKAMFFWHMVGNKLLTLVTNILYDSLLSDMETCYKVFRTEIIKGIPLRSRRFEFEPEITAKVLKRKHCIVEVPISYYGREYHEGKKISWRDAPVAFWTLLKYRFVD